jgi:hypothetical protein
MNAFDKNDLERANGHVMEAEERHARYSALVRRMAVTGQDTTDAENLLVRFKETLDLMRQHQQLVLRQTGSAL